MEQTTPPLFIPSAQGKVQLRNVHKVGRFATLRTVTALMLREMTSTYGRSPGGYLWAVLEPVAGIAVLSIIFSVAMRTPPLGSSFQLYYATGLLPFMMFMSTSNKIAQSLKYSRQLLVYPRVTIVDALLARLILNVMTQLLVIYLVLTGVVVFYDLTTTLVLSSVLLSLVMAVSLGAGIGVLNCFLFSQFTLWQSIWGIITRPLVLISGVIFLPENFPAEIRDILWYNPLVHVTGTMRHGFYHSYHADYVMPIYVFAVSLITGMVGFLFLWRYHRDILEK
jgi:capsular polysaccharide transport system permease protein